MEFRDVGQTLAGFVGNHRNRALRIHIAVALDVVLGHGLLYHHDTVFGEPSGHLRRVHAVFPTLVGIHIDWRVGTYFAYQPYHPSVLGVRLPELHLEKSRPRRFGSLPPHDVVGGVVAYGIAGERGVLGIEAPDSPPRLPHDLAEQVVQGDVHRSLGGAVAPGERVNPGEYVLHEERVPEIRQHLVAHPPQEGVHGSVALAQVGRHGGFPIAGEAAPVQAREHYRRAVARGTRYAESVFHLGGEVLPFKLQRPFGRRASAGEAPSGPDDSAGA